MSTLYILYMKTGDIQTVCLLAVNSLPSKLIGESIKVNNWIQRYDEYNVANIGIKYKMTGRSILGYMQTQGEVECLYIHIQTTDTNFFKIISKIMINIFMEQQ